MKSYIIDNKRYKKKFKIEELDKFIYKETRISKFPQYKKNYYNFFTDYAKKNYQLIDNDCLCKSKNDIILSETDRHCVEFCTVVCKSCGLIRAKEYFRDKDVIDFYQNFYRKENYYEHQKNVSSSDKFYDQKSQFKPKFDLIQKFKRKELKNLKILDLGGGAGGSLDLFDKSNELYLFDFYEPYLDFAKTKGIKSFKGGLENINFKPDLIIISHVMEHWNNFDKEMKKLIDVQKIGETINYIEFPGIDSLKDGRHQGDILRDIHVPHVYYFSSYVFENLMNRYGFEKLYIDNKIRSLFIYTGKKTKLINYYEKCKKDLHQAEKIRKKGILKNAIKLFIPKSLLKLIKKFA